MCKTWTFTFVLFLLGTACGDDGERPALPYKANETEVIGGNEFFNASDQPREPGQERGGISVATPDGDDCAELDGACVNPQGQCGDDGRADVLVDENGAVIDVICYPTGGIAIESYEGPVEDVGNNVVLVVDGADDGVDVVGDVTIDGNNVVLFGHGPDTSVIGGNLAIDKNHALVRGVRIQGDVVIDKNNPSLVDCVIEGDLRILGNNVSVALCEVWGTVTVEGNNAILVSNRFASAPEVTGQNLICNDDFAFADANDNGVIDEDEVGELIDCDKE